MGNVLCGDGRGVENWENRKNRKWFCLLWKKWWCYGEMDTTVGFSASNRSIYIFKREANNSSRMCYWGGFENLENRKNRKRFCLLRKNRWCYDEIASYPSPTCWLRVVHRAQRGPGVI